MQTLFPNTKQPRILVLGDLMLDHSISGDANKLANEGPIPVLHQTYDVWTLGGAGNVAANLAAMGADVTFASVVGADSEGERAVQLLRQSSIEWKGLTLKSTSGPNYKTTVKHRGFVGAKLLFRYDEETPTLSKYASELFHFTSSITGLITNKDSFDAVVFSDYNKGLCVPAFLNPILYNCKLHKIPTIVDPKGDFRKYKGCTLIKPNFDEADKFVTDTLLRVQLMSKTPEEKLAFYHEHLHKAVEPQFSCITRAKDGISLLEKGSAEPLTVKPQPIDVIDVTGAGDIVTATTAYCLAVSSNVKPFEMIKAAAFLATQKVQHRGTYTLKLDDFWAARMHLHMSKRIRYEDLLSIPRHKTIVFTNGCFDLLHTGHLTSLEFAKAQGGILIVGVNSDASIQRIKGPTRPIQSLEDRLRMLEALTCVDYVIPFEENSPLQIVKELRPNILVKGADYDGKEVQSANYAERLVLCPLRPGASTTSTISRIIDMQKNA